jgi:hypothetical protein
MNSWPAAAAMRAQLRHAVTAAITACALLCPAGPALALPDAIRDNLGVAPGAWTRWGSGEMRWLGIALYQATLYVAGKDAEQAPLALRLEYRRDIPGTRLVQATMEEMRRLGADPARLPAWEAQLQRLFPDVQKGDTITGVLIPGMGVRFFHQDRLRGELTDGDFGRWFFAIWLHPDSRSPALRSQLLQPPRKPA